MLSYPSSAEPKGRQPSIVKCYPENEIPAGVYKAVLEEASEIYHNLPRVTHKTWLSYSEISNYCNEILSERVKQYFLRLTHLDFLVNKGAGSGAQDGSPAPAAPSGVTTPASLLITGGNQVPENIKIAEPRRQFFQQGYIGINAILCLFLL